MNLTLPMALLIGFCVVMEAARELCFRHAAEGASFAQALGKKLTWVGIACWAVEIVAWVHVLQHVPLSIAYPLAALVYVITALGGVWFLHEKLTRRHTLGAFLVMAGVAYVGSTGA